VVTKRCMTWPKLEEEREDQQVPKTGKPQHEHVPHPRKTPTPRKGCLLPCSQGGGASYHSSPVRRQDHNGRTTPLRATEQAPGPTGTAPYAKGEIVNPGQSSGIGVAAKLQVTRRAFHIQQGSEHPGVDQLYNQICFESARPLPAGTAAQHPPAGDADRPAPQHNQQITPTSKMTALLYEAMAAFRHLMLPRPARSPRVKVPPGLRNRSPDIDRRSAAVVAGCLMRLQTCSKPRGLITREIDWRLRLRRRWCGLHTPERDSRTPC